MELNKELIVIYTEKGFLIDTEFTKEKTSYYDEKLYLEFKQNPILTFYHFGFLDEQKAMSSSLKFLHKITSSFIKTLALDSDIEITRSPQPITTETLLSLSENVPFAIGCEWITGEWLTSRFNELIDVFQNEIKDYKGSISDYLKSQDPALNIAGRVFFHLVENKLDESCPFAFLATYSTTEKKGKKAIHTPLKNALLEYKNQNDLLLKLLSTVSKVADKSSLISELVESGELFSPLKFTTKEAYIFLKEIPLYEECGILCRIPDWWKKKYNNAKLKVTIGEKTQSGVGLEALIDCRPELYFGDIKMSIEEMKQLLNESEGLALIKGKWVEVDHKKLESLLEAYETASKLSENGELSMAEAMRSQLTMEKALNMSQEENILEVSNGKWLADVKNRLMNPTEIEALNIGTDFKATLRGYQKSGVDWLYFVNTLSMGALLADDMGLGKTVQILALLDHLRENKQTKTLLIIPASLIANWQKEIDKFAPKLKYKILHTQKAEDLSIDEKDVDLYITTYGMAVRLEALKEITWDLLILDEAQAIKSPNTKQTKTIKQIPAHSRLAMTGTPIENRLSDLWSIFDFLNKGFLGSAKEFSNMIKDLNDYSKLRSAVSPFILRRVKTDKSIISDLPDKVEVNAYTSLSKKQIALYKNLVNELVSTIKSADGIQRKGIVLASIMKFKQICNHPDQYLGKEEFDSSMSGKFEKLREICETIYEKRERVLVFTQFKEMTSPLADFLETIFERKGLVLHGSTPIKKRGELVEQFCGEEYVPFMVLSLKAGGVGLNLTSANHVIHFDRWWNPAIENQATDRAFRIGQKKNVMVHKFITKGTIEERINEMLLEKQKLANDIIVDSGENWITELSNDELLSMIQLF